MWFSLLLFPFIFFNFALNPDLILILIFPENITTKVPAKSQHQCPSPNCGWHHASNALWVELENSPYNRRKNQEV